MFKNQRVCKCISLSLLSSFIIVSILSSVQNSIKVNAASTHFVKYMSNTFLGTSSIVSPKIPENDSATWLGNFVYFGDYNNSPMKYRVLDPCTDKYGETTMLLDCNDILFQSTGSSDQWKSNWIKYELNGSSFLNNPEVFTELERNAISKSYSSGHPLSNTSVMSDCIDLFTNYQGLSGEKIFLLDCEDVCNTAYGYAPWKSLGARRKRMIGGNLGNWWIRNKAFFAGEGVVLFNTKIDALSSNVDSYIGTTGYISTPWGSVPDEQTYYCGVSPAMNIDCSKILFSSVVEGSQGYYGSTYKLTLIDDEIGIRIPNGQSASLTDNTYSSALYNIYIPHEIFGSHKSETNSFTVFFTDKEYNDSDAKILKYEMLYNGKALEDKTTFVSIQKSYYESLGEWGKDFHVYMIAEQVNDLYNTDYASVPFEIPKPVDTANTSDSNDSIVDSSSEYCSVCIVYNDGTGREETINCYEGGYIAKPYINDMEGYSFAGWFSDIDCMNEFDFSQPIYSNCCIYAKWIQNVQNFDQLSVIDDDNSDNSFEDFVERLYVVALNRPSEQEGKAFWCEHVGNGNLNGAQCANEFLLSKEFKDRNLSNEEFLNVLYKTFFDRDAANDPDGYNFWMDCLKTQGRDSVVDCFINSEEWCNVCASYGVKSGATRAKASTASKNATEFATRLYTCCLGRDPEAEGLKFWSLGLTNLEVSGSSAAKQFFGSSEFIGFSTSNEEYLTRLYRTFMGREPDDGGMNYWLGEMSGGMTRNQVFDSFVASQEFTEICKEYGIDR